MGTVGGSWCAQSQSNPPRHPPPRMPVAERVPRGLGAGGRVPRELPWCAQSQSGVPAKPTRTNAPGRVKVAGPGAARPEAFGS